MATNQPTGSTAVQRRGRTPEPAVTDDEIELLTPSQLALIAPVVESLPQAGDIDLGAVLESMLGAQEPGDLNVFSDLPSLEDLVPVRMQVQRVRWMATTLDSKMPWYLIVDAKDVATGKQLVFNTSAAQPFMALVMIASKGWLPRIVEGRRRGKPTKRGYYPVNLIID